jgi:hypothetical protein
MKLARVGLISLVCAAAALAFGVVADATITFIMPTSGHVAKQPQPAPVAAAEPAAFALASASAASSEIAPTRVKTIPIMLREERPAELAAEHATAAVPLPRPRPASAPAAVMAMGADASIARQPGAMAISAATRKAAPDDGDPLSPAGIDRMKTALALTAEQEEFWPAIAAELRTIGKLLKSSKGQPARISVDDEQIQRLYWAAAPLITRLSPEQKHKAKQMARLMGLNEVAAAL